MAYIFPFYTSKFHVKRIKTHLKKNQRGILGGDTQEKLGGGRGLMEDLKPPTFIFVVSLSFNFLQFLIPSLGNDFGYCWDVNCVGKLM